MNVDLLNLQTVKISLENSSDTVRILEPSTIIMFHGDGNLREDRRVKIKHAFAGNRLYESIISGPCSFVLSLPSGCYVNIIPVTDELLFDVKNVLFYPDNLEVNRIYQSWPNILATSSITRYEFKGSGKIGIMTGGPIISEILDDNHCYVDVNSLVALPKSAKIEVGVYGNGKAEQHMAWQYLISGTGTILIDTASSTAVLLTQGLKSKDNIVMRAIKDNVPGAGTLIP
ncbi:MAG: hypothetical protein PHC92_07580 [Syntrophomonadaceae bacterium]|nr:hypothetical protein [Syntrophomonadaceae bacterium]MDD3022797.1 hypothetical protein [Syntrophomonadaceae bacterium]